MSRFQCTEIGEPVKVGAVFDKARIHPRWFVWGGRKYDIRRVTYEWVDSTGAAKLYCYSVWDGRNIYEIALNLKLLSWSLKKVYLE